MPTLMKPPDARMIERNLQAGQTVLLEDLSWQEYQRFMHSLNRPRVRFTFDQGSLELMPTSWLHEIYRWLLGMFVVTLADELNTPFYAGGQMTFEREDLDRGLQPDDCFWIANAGKMRGKTRVDFTVDPAPDLALEVDIASSSLSRLVVYAALQVPEVWRFKGVALEVGILIDGEYQWGERSLAFPELRVGEIVPFLLRENVTDHLSTLREFRQWVRANLVSA